MQLMRFSVLKNGNQANITAWVQANGLLPVLFYLKN